MHTASRIAAILTLLAAGGLHAAEADTGAPAAAPLTMQQAVDKALAQRPGEVMGTDRERKNGREAWEVEIRDANGQEWELYYAIDDGSLLYEERD
ncbi:PepSY domain-containing protein [uncultured Thiohalocapsa sp.]|uniref:PepSY domain-containing protein n=1 Tax=uncultured Thiohalocapsa sp. TaxID=768990 RepID=UPI0025DDB7D6|nr:PepSY domain-containing protein [uncultured Thiohalocapsa sp.]